MSDFDYSQYEDTPEPKGSGNRTFAIIAGILGVIIVLALVGGAAYALFIMPEQAVQQADLAAKISAENTATIMAATSESLLAAAASDTPEPASAPTQEPVVAAAVPAMVATEPASAAAAAQPQDAQPTADSGMQATVVALLTQSAGGIVQAAPAGADATALPVATLQAAPTMAPTPAALPATGIADEMGIPAMFGLAVLFIAVIMVTRQLRTANSHR